ncbi:MAG: hypothetical protein ALECFALPRED_010630 [Alectoria fallacina]|uniref:Uncharacterized protein n=1 Tax=Alectoria fallacina TaxID=1903189 RepID=A0A8H3PK82_9LECA|nr:MAG: hypothetical protein ALECFALPRED_010630 [Alectoria fallacina]
MATPPPYGSPDNSPLNADGSNFPCKATSNSGGTVTNMAVGASQKLSFLGESVHGGGSCQVSLTTDTPATKSSTWMVIHSIEGGCPARNQAGNIGADDSASAPDPDTKREAFLNETQEYAILELFGRTTASFPAIFVANIPTTDCTTAEGTDVKFPNPGLSVEMASANKADVLTPPTGPKYNGASGSSSSASSDTQASNAGSSGASGAPAAVASPGASICSPDGLQIGTCTTESTVTWIPVAAGTRCVDGYMVAAKGKRSAKFLSGYFF